jgi:hypothetical protein
VDLERIAQIRSMHRPRIYWLGCAVSIGCTCGTWVYPCAVVWEMYAQLELRRVGRPNTGRFR